MRRNSRRYDRRQIFFGQLNALLSNPMGNIDPTGMVALSGTGARVEAGVVRASGTMAVMTPQTIRLTIPPLHAKTSAAHFSTAMIRISMPTLSRVTW